MAPSSCASIPPPHRWQKAAAQFPGLALVAALAAFAIALGTLGWFASTGISALTVAIVLGMLAGNTLYPRVARRSAAGVAFSKQTLLRLGIILYGLRLTFQDIAHVGIAGVAIDSVVLSSTFILSWWMGTRLFRLERETALLIGAGSAICGAAAVMATGPVVRARAEQVTVAVSTVVVFGTIAIFLYPALYHGLNRHHGLAISPASYGIFAGSTIHEVAQVVAAGRSISEGAANTAVITKMVRVMMLAPFLAILSTILARAAARTAARTAREPNDAPQPGRLVIPWFAVGFIGVAAFNSLGVLPKTVVAAGTTFDTVILAMAMAALGLTTHVSAIRAAGIKPLALAAMLFAWLLLGGGAINAAIRAVLG
ncbi:MAG: YeiH family protein [Pseudomonadota bacterium]|nr:YeiH family protein [Pseudomonadota bacterium]